MRILSILHKFKYGLTATSHAYLYPHRRFALSETRFLSILYKVQISIQKASPVKGEAHVYIPLSQRMSEHPYSGL